MSVLDRIKNGQISFLFLLIGVFLLPVNRELFIISLWPWILFRLLEGVLSKEFPGKLYQRNNFSIYFLPAFFFLLLLSLLWSDNISAGLTHLGRSTLMIILPLILGTDLKVIQRIEHRRQLFKVYVIGAFLALIFLWSYAIIFSMTLDNGRIIFDPLVREWENAFFHKAFSFLIHPTYFGMMILMATAICLNEIKVRNLFSKSPVWPLLLSIIFIGSLFFISSRAMIGSAIILVLYYLLSRIANKKILIFTLLMSIVVLFSIAGLHPRFRNFRDLVTEGNSIFSYEYFREATDRGKTWQTSYLLIADNPILGVGIGDVKDAMIEKYLEMGYYTETDHYLNSHNQFLETWLAIGLGGLLFLVLMLLYPLIRNKGHSRFLYSSFLIICLIAFLFESVLNRLWGVAFFTLFYLLLAQDEKQVKINIQE